MLEISSMVLAISLLGNVKCADAEQTLKPMQARRPVFISELPHPEIVVVLGVEVGKGGEVSAVQVRCSEPASRAAERSALSAVRKWRFEPGALSQSGSVVVRLPSNTVAE